MGCIPKACAASIWGLCIAMPLQNSAVRSDVLANAIGEEGLDWALAWTVETLISNGQKWEKVGVFKQAPREVYKLDAYNLTGKLDGLTDITRALILPHRAYQVMEEKHSEAFADVRKLSLIHI